jgi:RHS repeat-associated protein
VTLGQYGYNAFGERTNKRDLTHAHDYAFIYGEGHRLLADRENGAWTNYVWFAGELVGMTRAGAVYQIDNDHLGRPELITNANKAVVWQSNNDPFGGMNPTTNTLGEFNIGLPGQYFDAESNYWYNVSRYYVPAIGRYLQADLAGLAGGLNPYTYVGANPVNRVDPLGLWSFSFEAYDGFGGGFVVGQDPATNQWFYGGRLGFGIGGGASFDYQGKRPGADGPDCDHGTTVGVFLQAGASVGPYQWNPVDAHGGYDLGKGQGYSEGPAGGNLTFGNGEGVELSGAFGLEIIGH